MLNIVLETRAAITFAISVDAGRIAAAAAISHAQALRFDLRLAKSPR